MKDPDIALIRSFNRTVTRRLGVLTDRFLGRDRPLAEARVIFEIGRDGIDVRDLRAGLGLDSGYVSRLLRSLERQKLIKLVPLDDRRARRAQLTAAGRKELAELNRRGDEFARGLLQALSDAQRKRMLQAMGELDRLFRGIFVEIAPEDPASEDARHCVSAYFAELSERFPDGFDPTTTIPAEPADLTPPNGVLLIARLDGRPVGCGALKSVAKGVGSIKRMWVAPSMRGLGLGRRILEELERHASELSMTLLQLETNDTLDEAQALYRRYGYNEVPPFNDEPHAHHWFEKRIPPRRRARRGA